nr:carbohydrate-binding protein [Novosphingobium panipatense]
MRVVLDSGETLDLGETEATPTIGIVDYSRRETDDYGVTTVVERDFARRMSVRLVVPFDQTDALQASLAAIRAKPARWIADEGVDWLDFRGFFKDFEIDLPVPPKAYCTLTVEALTATEAFTDPGGDPAPLGHASTLQLLQPATIAGGALVATSVPENDYPEWSADTTYPLGARVIKAATHRIYESGAIGNKGNDPAGTSGKWQDIGPTNRWAMFDQALGSTTTAAGQILVTLSPGTINAAALLDVKAATVRVQAGGYDRTLVPNASGTVTFLDLPETVGQVSMTIAGPGTVEVGTLLVGKLVGLGSTTEDAKAGITDFSRKEADEFGEIQIVERAWAKRMTLPAKIRRDAIDMVAGRIAAVRAKPSLWIGKEGMETLTVYGFFKDFSIAVDTTICTLSLSIEGLSTAGKVEPLTASVAWPDITDPDGTKPDDNATRNVNRGAWAAGLSYQVGDFFQYGGSSYTVITAHVSTAGLPPPNQFVSLMASAGVPGNDGLPGAKGADGTTFYTWIAYADSADGVLNFTTGAPAGRTFIGIASNKTSAVESANPGDYTWSAYAGPPNFGLVAGTNAAVAGNRVYKVSGGSNGWNSQVVSSESFFGGANLTVKPEANDFDFFVGLNSDPFTDDSYASLDYAWRITPGSKRVEVWINGQGMQGWDDNFSLGDTFSIQYDGKKVRWIRSGTINGAGYSYVFYEADAAAGLRFWFDSSMAWQDATRPQFSVVTWSAMGAAGADGAKGDKGDAGTAGEAAITPSLTSPARQVWAYANGGVKSYDGVSTTFVLKQGSVDVSANFNVVIASNPNGLQVSLSGRTATVVGATGNAGEFGNANVLSATLTLRATGTGAFTGRNFDLNFTLGKLTGGYEIVSSTPTTGNFEGREVFSTGDGKRYTFVNGGWVATITSATVIADSQLAGMSATKLVGTVDTSKMGVGVGGNRLVGAVPATRPDLYMVQANANIPGATYEQNATYGGPLLSPLPNGQYPNGTASYTLPDLSGFCIHQTNSARHPNGEGDWFAFRFIRDMNGGWTSEYSCEDGKSYEFSVYMGAHRCPGDLIMAAVNSAGAWVAQAPIDAAATITSAEGKLGGTHLGAWKRCVARMTIPLGAGATRIFLYVRKYGTDAGQGDSWLFMCYPQLAETVPNATSMIPYSPPPQAIMVAQNIYANSLTSDVIAANAIGTDELAARAVTAKNLTMMDFENLMVDGDLASGTLDAWSRSQNGVGGMQIYLDDGGAGTTWPSRYALHFRRNGFAGGNELTIVNGRESFDSNSRIYGIACLPGDEFAFEAVCWADAGGNVNFEMVLRADDGSTTSITATAVYNMGSEGWRCFAFPGTNFTVVRCNFSNNTGKPGKAFLRVWGPNPEYPNSQCYVWNTKLRRRNNAQIIIDGSVFANHIAAGQVQTDHLGAGSVIASKIAVTELSAITGNIGLLRTATTGQRTEIDNNGVRSYHPNGALAGRFGNW